MAFIKAQKIVRDENGTITSGSAAIVDTAYVSTGQKNHSKQTVREKLGKVLYLSEDRKSGILGIVPGYRNTYRIRGFLPAPPFFGKMRSDPDIEGRFPKR